MSKLRVYTKRPKGGNARKAWDKFLVEFNTEPKEIYYTNTYDYEFRGWICEMQDMDPGISWLGYSNTKNTHTFYMSNDL